MVHGAFSPEKLVSAEGTAKIIINRVLLLDGRRYASEDLLKPLVLPSEIAVTAVHAPTDQDLGPANSPAFAHRELWSSSLLLGDTTSRNYILQGHVDWIEGGADIVTTVTYQCHYEKELWPLVLREKDKNGEETMSQMFQDALQIAQEATHHTQTHRRNDNESTQLTENKERSFVVASLGCYGSALSNGAEYTGAYGETLR
jgi:hypothetical protein